MSRGIYDPKIYDPRIYDAGGHEITADYVESPDIITAQIITISYGVVSGGAKKPERKKEAKPVRRAIIYGRVIELEDIVVCSIETEQPSLISAQFIEPSDIIYAKTVEDPFDDEMVLQFIAECYAEEEEHAGV